MNALAKGMTTVVLAIAAAACDGSPTAGSAFVSENDGIAVAQQPGSTLTFSSTQSQSEASPQTASGGVGGIDFTGSLTTGTPCYTVTASHTDRRGSITVTVSAASSGGICTQVITNNNYTGRVSGLAAGTYNFSVVHQGGFGGTHTAYSSTVTVQ
jgi:hypothetical protein